jgi:hypothetical protein
VLKKRLWAYAVLGLAMVILQVSLIIAGQASLPMGVLAGFVQLATSVAGGTGIQLLGDGRSAWAHQCDTIGAWLGAVGVFMFLVTLVVPASTF